MKQGFPTGSAGESAAPDESQSRFTPPEPEELAEHFPQLEIVEFIGQGGMGVVYKARQKSLNRLVALKLLAPGREKDAAFAQRFAIEAETLAKLNHANIVTVHDFGEANGMFYLVMEFVDGVNLRRLLQERKLSPEEALAIVPPICEALQFAHDQGVVHRDIKPENLLLDKQGRVKIADFGIAKILGRAGSPVPTAGLDSGGGAHEVAHPTAGLTGEQKAIGTPQYMAPEQTASPQKVDHRVDIYSLGVVLYEMLTGEPPAKEIQPPSRKVQVDVRIDEIVLRALETEPERRYQTASQFKTMVETMASSSPARRDEPTQTAQVADPQTKTPASRPSAKERRLPHWLAAAIGLLIAGVWGYFSDLRNGDVGWFLGRIIFVPSCVVGVNWLMARRRRLKNSGPAGDEGRKVANAAANQSRVASAATQQEPRFSRTAIVGACWAPFLLIGLLPMFVLTDVPAEQYRGPAWWQVALLVTLLPLGLSAPFGTTILGWIAVSQIRRSMGRLYGLGLAVFDGLVFPLLALDALIFWIVWLAFQALASVTKDGAQLDANLSTSLLLTILIAAPVNWVIVRRVWRAVNKPQAATPSSKNPSPPGSNSKRGIIKPVVVTAIIHGLVLILAAFLITMVIAQFAAVFADLNVELPVATRLALSFSNLLKVWGLLIVPMAWIADGAACCLAYFLGHRRGLRIWSACFLFGLVALTGLCFVPVASTLRQVRENTNMAATNQSNPERKLEAEIRDGPTAAGVRASNAGEFVAFHPATDGTAALDAARDFVLEHNWRLLREGGNNERVTIQAQDGAGKQVTFEEALQAGGEVARLTVSTEPGAQIPAKRIGSELWHQLGWGDLTASNTNAETNHPSFGPVIERELVGNKSLTNCFLDVETGRVLSAPTDLLESLRAQGQLGRSLPQVTSIADWARANGVDFMFRPGESRLLLIEGITIPSAKKFEAHLASEVIRFPGDPEIASLAKPNSHMACDFDSTETGPRSWIFRTREGGSGVLQITVLTDRPQAVKVRYKLVQEQQEIASPLAGSSGLYFSPRPDVFARNNLTVASNELNRLWIQFEPHLRVLSPSSMPPAVFNSEDPEAASEWLREQGCDAAGGVTDGKLGLKTLDLTINPVTPGFWTNGTPDNARDRLRRFGQRDIRWLPAPANNPSVWLFRTRNGGEGMLRLQTLVGDKGRSRLTVESRLIHENKPSASAAPLTARIQLMQSEPSRRYWRWRVFREAGARMIYGVLDVTDPEHPSEVLMARENDPLSTNSSQDFMLRLNPDSGNWRVEIESEWIGTNGGRDATWQKVKAPSNAILNAVHAKPFGELNNERYYVFWEGELVSGGRMIKRLRFIGRLASPEDPVQKNMGPNDTVREFDESAMPISAIAQANGEAKTRAVGTWFSVIPLALVGLLAGVGLIAMAIWWLVAGVKANAAMQRGALLLAIAGPFIALLVGIAGRVFGISPMFLAFPAFLACEIPAFALGLLARQTGLGKAAMIVSATFLLISLSFLV